MGKTDSKTPAFAGRKAAFKVRENGGTELVLLKNVALCQLDHAHMLLQ
jgi:hypothetical protein